MVGISPRPGEPPGLVSSVPRHVTVLLLLSLFLPAGPTRAQDRGSFVDATLQFVQAADGRFGDEGRYLLAAVDAMERALAEWDAALARARVEMAPVALAALEIERGRFERALDALDRAEALAPADPYPCLLRALALDRLGRADGATAAYRDAWRRSPDTLVAAYRVALSSALTPSWQGDRAAALDALSAAVQRPSNARRFVVPTDELLDDRSAQAPLLPLARYAPAFALLQRGRYDEAVSALRAAAASDPLTHAPSEVVAAAGALRVGDWSGALDRLAAVSTPDVAAVHRVRAAAYRGLGDSVEALAELNAAIDLDPADERARLAAADLLVESGRAADAALTLRAASKERPGSLQAHWQLARSAMANQDWRAALDALTPIAGSRPLAGAAPLYGALARTYAARGEGEAAVRALKERVAVIPHSSAAHGELGVAYRRAGQPLEARVELLAALLLDSTNEPARAALAALK